MARHLHEAVKSGTTSVIVYGSGGVCDLLVDLIRHHDSLVGGGILIIVSNFNRLCEFVYETNDLLSFFLFVLLLETRKLVL